MSSSKGVPPSGSGHSASPEPVVSALRASVPNASELRELAQHCERTKHSTVGLDKAIWRAAVSTADERETVETGLCEFGEAEAEFRIGRMMDGRSYSNSIDDALTLVPEAWSAQIGRGWRCDIKEGLSWASVMNRQYGPSDVHGNSENAATPALAVCAAALRALASGMEARSGETACGLDPKDDSPVPQADAQ